MGVRRIPGTQKSLNQAPTPPPSNVGGARSALPQHWSASAFPFFSCAKAFAWFQLPAQALCVPTRGKPGIWTREIPIATQPRGNQDSVTRARSGAAGSPGFRNPNTQGRTEMRTPIHSLNITYASWVFVQLQGDGVTIANMENETPTSPTGWGLGISSLSQLLSITST